MNAVPENITHEISETDENIKKLEEQLFFKKSKQNRKMRRKIENFLNLLEIEVSEEDLDKLEDEVEIIFFLIDIFSEKYNQVMEEKGEIHQILANINEDTFLSKEQLEQENRFLRDKNTEQAIYIRDLEL